MQECVLSTDRRSVRTRQALRAALAREIDETGDLSRVTVTAVTERAGVTRRTFYSHFRDIPDLVNQIEEETLAELRGPLARLASCHLDDLREALGHGDPAPGAAELLRCVRERGNYLRPLLGDGGDPAFAEREDLTHVEKLVGSATSFVEHFRERGFTDVVLSAKAHDVPTTVEVNRALSRSLPEVPLHIGVTEAGTLRQGTVKNAAAVGALLMEGIGDTIRLSLTADPVEEVGVAWDLLSAVGLRRLRPELVSCPTCGRCQWDLMGVAAEVERRLADVRAPITVAVMGCVVNGPGEAKGADIGLAGGRGRAVLFAQGEKIRTVDEADAVDELLAEIGRRFS